MSSIATQFSQSHTGTWETFQTLKVMGQGKSVFKEDVVTIHQKQTGS